MTPPMLYVSMPESKQKAKQKHNTVAQEPEASGTPENWRSPLPVRTGR
jgi:hypothetical protein